MLPSNHVPLVMGVNTIIQCVNNYLLFNFMQQLEGELPPQSRLILLFE